MSFWIPKKTMTKATTTNKTKVTLRMGKYTVKLLKIKTESLFNAGIDKSHGHSCLLLQFLVNRFGTLLNNWVNLI